MNHKIIILLSILLFFSCDAMLLNPERYGINQLLRFTYPNGGEIDAGEEIDIEWDTMDGYGIDTIKILLLNEHDKILKIIVDNTPNIGSFNWTAHYVNDTTKYGLRIEQVNGYAYDETDGNFKILPVPYFEITSPAGGENWNEQSSQSITWNYGGDVDNYVKIYYSIDGGTTWNTISSGYESNDGESNWIVPNLTSSSNEAVIKIGSYNNADEYDISEYFTLTADSTYFEVTSPAGGEIWNEQSIQSITWNSGGDVDNYVKIYYSIDGGTTWNTILSGYESNDGESNWTVSNLTSSSNEALIKIRSYDNADEYDISEYFTLTADSTYYRVTSPNGGETWEELSTQTITWESSGDVESEHIYVSLYYSLDGGAGWTEIDNSVENEGTYSWTLPEIYITNATCRIKVKQKYSPYIEDISDADFTISAGGGQSDIINIISANGGEVWHEQTTEEITWSTTGDIGGNEVYVGYSTDGGNYWYDAVDDGGSNSSEGTANPPRTSYWDETSNNGSYSWSLPNFSDTLETCIIGVWSAGNTALYDMSDNHFTITCDSNYYRILHPNGGETFQMETGRYILWESGGDVGSVKLYYSEYGGDSWYLIDDNETNDGSCVWSVPTLQSDNPNCLIKIEDRSNSGWFDVSDATFTIGDTAIFEIDMDFEEGESLEGWSFEGQAAISSTDAYSGVSSILSIGSGQTGGSVIKTINVNTGIIRFYFKTYYYRDISFTIDGQTTWSYDATSSQTNWQLAEIAVQGGTYTFEWIFSYYNGSGDFARIDAIIFP